jgi:hypothetical protein
MGGAKYGAWTRCRPSRRTTIRLAEAPPPRAAAGVRASASLWEKSAYLRHESDEFLAARLDLVGGGGRSRCESRER